MISLKKSYFQLVSHSKNIVLIFHDLLVEVSEDEVDILIVPALVALAVSTYTEKV